MTLTMAPAAWATSTTAPMSPSTSASRPRLQRADLEDHVELARAVADRPRRASKTLVSVRWLPCGKPIVVPTATSVPSRIARARATSAGPDADRGHVVGEPRAGSRPRRTRRRARGAAANGRSSWRRRGRSGCRWTGSSVSLDVRAEDVAGEQEPALDEVVGLLEVAVLVLDDHVAVVAGAPQRGEQRRPLDVAETRAVAGPASRSPSRRRRARTGPRGRSEVLGLDVEDVRPELADEPRDVDHLEDRGATGRS